MTDSSISLRCKKHTLVEHWNNVSQWFYDVRERTNNLQMVTEQDKQTIVMLAYERWLNDRPLLTDEDQYQWHTRREDWIGDPPGTIG